MGKIEEEVTVSKLEEKVSFKKEIEGVVVEVVFGWDKKNNILHILEQPELSFVRSDIKYLEVYINCLKKGYDYFKPKMEEK